MIALGLLALAALLGGVNFYLHVKYNATPVRDRAAPWGVAASCALFAAVVAAALQNFNPGELP